MHFFLLYTSDLGLFFRPVSCHADAKFQTIDFTTESSMVLHHSQTERYIEIPNRSSIVSLQIRKKRSVFSGIVNLSQLFCF